jgi:hypothetical protein
VKKDVGGIINGLMDIRATPKTAALQNTLHILRH